LAFGITSESSDENTEFYITVRIHNIQLYYRTQTRNVEVMVIGYHEQQRPYLNKARYSGREMRLFGSKTAGHGL
jgi:hypothetical protein